MTTLGGIFLTLLAVQVAAPPVPPADTGSIEGMVLSFDSGEPIGRAVVELRSTPRTEVEGMFANPGELETLQRFLRLAASSRTFTSSADGKFSFQNLPAGEYRIYATRNTGYIPGEYGQRSPVGTGTALKLGAGQKVSGVRLSMAPTASIAGRILDRDGDPVVYGRVELLRTAYQDGKRILLIAQMVMTDDHGEYRLHSLPPGQYYVAAQPFPNRSMRWGPSTQTTVMPSRSASQQVAHSPLVTRRVLETGVTVEETWVQMFYPGTPDSHAAQPLLLDMGENRQGIDISLAYSGAPVRRVLGVVVDGATGKPAADALVCLIPRDQRTPDIVMPSGNTGADGRFDLQGVAPASYSLLVSGSVTGFMVLDVADTDIVNLLITGITGVNIPWRVTLEGGAGASPNDNAIGRNLSIKLVRDPIVTTETTTGTVTTAGWPGLPDGFVIPPSRAVPTGGFMLQEVGLGDYRVSVVGLPRGTYIKSIRTGRTDVLKDGLRVAGVLENPLEILLGNDSGTLSGRAVSERQEPAAHVTVVLVPNPLLRFRTDLYRQVTADDSGRFRIEGIAPGEYELFAWEEVASGAWHDPDFIRTQAGRSVSVNVRQGDNATSDVKVIPWNNGQ